MDKPQAIVFKEPAYLHVVLARHAERVKATRDRLNRKLTSLSDKRLEIEANLMPIQVIAV